MKMGDAILAVRDAIGEKTSTVNVTGPGYADATMVRIFARAESIYYRKEIGWDSSRFLVKGTLTGTGNALIDLPDNINFTMVYAIYADTNRLIKYIEVPFSDDDDLVFQTGVDNYYYFLGGQIGIVPTLALGSTLFFDRYRQNVKMTYTSDSDLHPYSVEAAILYTAKQAMKFRGDGNWKLVEDELEKYERDMLPKISRSSRVATPILPRRSSNIFEIIGIH